MKRTGYTEAPAEVREAIAQSEVIADFLPSPEQLVFREQSVKVTLELSKRSVDLFKRYARRKGYRYQRMIRTLVDQYATRKLG